MKIAHEAPLSIFDKVQQLTDYDYFLVHLFEENVAYYEKAQECVRTKRETILDNSIFELGTAFDPQKFAVWVEKLAPTYYIIPDVLEDSSGTLDSFENFMTDYKNIPGKTIAVAQGNSYDDMVKCYNYLVHDDRVDKIAISFDYCFFDEAKGDNKYARYMNGRQDLIERMLKEDIIKTDKPHHLLGCGLPQEFKAYTKYDWIDSLDTSNPVIHGMKEIWYDAQGLANKESVKLFTLINEDVNEHWAIIEYNIKTFRSYCR